LGDIAQRIALRAQSFGMRTVACDPWQLETRMATMELGVQLMSLDAVLQTSDFVSLHVPLTDQTHHLINADTLAKMKPGAYLINTARGGVVNEDDLVAAVKSRRLAGAVLDVRSQEPPPKEDGLRLPPEIVSTPHIAGLTQEAGRRTALMVAEDVLRVLSGRAPLGAV
jgi:D-3-phosphoglycerate dehydrogenase/(S)-sulfolactate dehydrogenase